MIQRPEEFCHLGDDAAVTFVLPETAGVVSKLRDRIRVRRYMRVLSGSHTMAVRIDPIGKLIFPDRRKRRAPKRYFAAPADQTSVS